MTFRNSPQIVRNDEVQDMLQIRIRLTYHKRCGKASPLLFFRNDGAPVRPGLYNSQLTLSTFLSLPYLTLSTWLFWASRLSKTSISSSGTSAGREYRIVDVIDTSHWTFWIINMSKVLSGEIVAQHNTRESCWIIVHGEILRAVKIRLDSICQATFMTWRTSWVVSWPMLLIHSADYSSADHPGTVAMPCEEADVDETWKVVLRSS